MENTMYRVEVELFDKTSTIAGNLDYASDFFETEEEARDYFNTIELDKVHYLTYAEQKNKYSFIEKSLNIVEVDDDGDIVEIVDNLECESFEF